MTTTRASLLLKVRDPSDGGAWSRFYDLYAPLLLSFARRQGLELHDAEEVRDRCLAALARKMPDFVYEPARGRFHSYLYRMALGHVQDLRRRQKVRATVPLSDSLPDELDPEADWDKAWQAERLRWALDRAAARASERDAHVFGQLLAGTPADEVARRYGLRRNHVYKIKSRMIADVRRMLDEA